MKKNKTLLYVGLAAAAVGIYLLVKNSQGNDIRSEVVARFAAFKWLNASTQQQIESMPLNEAAIINQYLIGDQKSFTADQLAVAKKYGWWADRWPA